MDRLEKEMFRRENRNWEYQHIHWLLRFFAGVRFGALGSFGTFFAILISAYSYVWSNKQIFEKLWPDLLLFISWFGLVVTITAWLIEKRTIVLYQTCLQRGRQIENELGISEGIYDRLIVSATVFRILKIPATHTAAIRCLYLTVTAIWIGLMVFSYLIRKGVP